MKGNLSRFARRKIKEGRDTIGTFATFQMLRMGNITRKFVVVVKLVLLREKNNSNPHAYVVSFLFSLISCCVPHFVENFFNFLIKNTFLATLQYIHVARPLGLTF